MMPLWKIAMLVVLVVVLAVVFHPQGIPWVMQLRDELGRLVPVASPATPMPTRTPVPSVGISTRMPNGQVVPTPSVEPQTEMLSPAVTPTPTATPRPDALYVVLASSGADVDAEYVDVYGLRFEPDAIQLAVGDFSQEIHFAVILQPSAYPKLTVIEGIPLIGSGSWQHEPAFIMLDGTMYDAWVLEGGLAALLRHATVRIGRSSPVPTPTPTLTPTATATPLPTPTPTATATATPAPTATLTVPKSVGERGSGEWIAALEQRIHELINRERVLRNLTPLGFDARLASVARSHSVDMAMNDFFSHTNLRGQSPSDRGAAVGYGCRKDYGSYYTYGLAENIYHGSLYSRYWTRNGVVVSKDYYELEDLASLIVDGWMASPGHHANIVKSSYDVEGIGVAISADEGWYATQNFC